MQRLLSRLDSYRAKGDETVSHGTIHWETLEYRPSGHAPNSRPHLRPSLYVSCDSCSRRRLVYWDSFKVWHDRGVFTGRCKACDRSLRFGADNPNWKEHKINGDKKYQYVCVHPDDPMAVMGHKQRRASVKVAEHRLVMARHLGRPLRKSEHVHHVNGNKRDNRIENLELVDGSTHCLITTLESRVEQLESLLETYAIPVPPWHGGHTRALDT